jgi:AICAR transformylase/IMP cyclohydrolase PurH
MQLKYGCNPHQPFASAEAIESAPLRLLNGTPSIINLLDALNAWQLVSELRSAIGLPAAASFKHVSPAGAAVAAPLSRELSQAYEVETIDLSPAALAYVRARGADPKCSFGDFVALSEPVDDATAGFLKSVVADGIIAPGFVGGALETLTCLTPSPVSGSSPAFSASILAPEAHISGPTVKMLQPAQLPGR